MQRSNLCRESAVVALLLSLAGCGADPIQVEPAALASDNVAASTDPQGSGQVGLDGRASSDPGSDSGSGVSGDGAVGQGGAGGQDGASAGADPGGAAEPPPEGSGPEAPQPTRAGEPVLSLPSLPMGGDSADGSDGPQQCVQVSWLSSRVPPPGLRVRITGHAFSPDGPFSVGGSACAGRSPLCLSGFAFTANEIDNGRKSCYIPVQASGSGDPGSSVTLILSGEMPCPPSQLAACRTFELEVGNSSSQVSLSVPYPPETTAPEPTGPEPTAVKPTASTSAAASSSAADKPSPPAASSPLSADESSAGESSAGGSSDKSPADKSPAGDASSDSSPASSAAS
ncbi:MAG: hypothetical protein IPG94_14800 [Kineosporiaceae bacterium]|nr:hypothetical protein [Kineosporiaceae bacterium]